MRDHVENVLGRRLPFQPRLNFIKQARVVDRDHRLISKAFDQLDLSPGERFGLGARKVQNADHFALEDQRHRNDRPPSAQERRFRVLEFRVGVDIGDMNGRPLQHRSARDILAGDLVRVVNVELDEFRPAAGIGADVQFLTHLVEQNADGRPAQFCGRIDQGLQHRGQIKGGLTDDLQNIRGRGGLRALLRHFRFKHTNPVFERLPCVRGVRNHTARPLPQNEVRPKNPSLSIVSKSYVVSISLYSQQSAGSYPCGSSDWKTGWVIMYHRLKKWPIMTKL